MNLDQLRQQLPIGQLGEPLHYFTSIGSTNDRAKELAEAGMASGGLVLADEQTAGRGRFERSWFTPAGSALALSVLLRDLDLGPARIPALNALGALAVATALEQQGGKPQLKWPNDVILGGSKVAGVLVEASWQESSLDFVVIGIGVNVDPASVPPAEELEFAATSVAAEMGSTISREDLLIGILTGLNGWLDSLGTDQLMEAWNDRLAYKGKIVELQGRQQRVRGELLGVGPDGRIELELEDGRRDQFGDDFIRLRPVDRNAG